MKIKVTSSLLTLVALIALFLTYTQSASSSSFNQPMTVPRPVSGTSNMMPAFATTFDVDRTDDAVAATAWTAAPKDFSLRGAINGAHGNFNASTVIINLAPSSNCNL